MKTTDLSGQVALVTGVGQQPATAVALALAAAGARVAAADLNPDLASRVAQQIRDAGGEAIDVSGDVANKFQCVHLIETTRAEWRRLDILVNGTAIHPHTPLLKMDEWEWTRALDVNLKGVFFMSQLCGRVFADENQVRGGATIVNLGSTAALATTDPGGAAFAASQTGLLGLTRECAREYRPLGIGVNTILRGAAGDPLPDGAMSLYDAGLPDDIAAAVVALCSPDGRQINGRILVAEMEHG